LKIVIGTGVVEDIVEVPKLVRTHGLIVIVNGTDCGVILK
jgi:hypothetical protein